MKAYEEETTQLLERTQELRSRVRRERDISPELQLTVYEVGVRGYQVKATT